MKLKFSDWKRKVLCYRSKGLSSLIRVKKHVVYRESSISPKVRLEEGIIVEYLERDVTIGEKEYQPAQRHLIGYHYVALIEKNTDFFWIQGNIFKGEYIIFAEGCIHPILDRSDRKKAFKVFREELKKRYNIEVEDEFADRSEIQKLI
ncbi:MAG: hypothetical protein J7K36_01275 [Archaeoglobaceae archaeon]|nr:hypothetical protein [Archaeoglobaceae archaeon]